MSSRPCAHREWLSGNPFMSVQRCACGQVHVNLGAMTIRFDESSFAELRRVVDEAWGALDDAQRGSALFGHQETAEG